MCFATRIEWTWEAARRTGSRWSEVDAGEFLCRIGSSQSVRRAPPRSPRANAGATQRHHSSLERVSRRLRRVKVQDTSPTKTTSLEASPLDR